MKRNCRRLSGDGSAKVVSNPEIRPEHPGSESEFKTARRREPPPCHSTPTQKVCPVVACASRVRVEAPSRCHSLPSFLFPTTDHGRLANDQSKNIDSSISHFISSKTPAIPAFSSNPTSTSHQKVDCFPCESAFVVDFPVLAHLCWLRFLPFLMFKIPGKSPTQNPSKKPVSSPKFTFQHSAQTLCLSVSVVKFVHLQNVESFSSFPWLPSVQIFSRSRICSTNSSKKPVSSPPLFAKRTSMVGNIIVAGLGSLTFTFQHPTPVPLHPSLSARI
jgi:hypothetical protein